MRNDEFNSDEDFGDADSLDADDPPRGEPVDFLHEDGFDFEDEFEPNESDEELIDDRELDRLVAGDTMGLYLREMTRVPLLSSFEEIELATRIESGRQAQEHLAHAPPSERHAEWQSLVEDAKFAREHLIKANMRLVVSIAKRHLNRGVLLHDLIQEGNIGLMKAIEKFDYKRGYRFSTYATWWIRQTITRAIADHGRTIRVPAHMSDRIRKLYRTVRELEQFLGRTPTVEEIATAMQIEPRQIEWLLKVSWQPLSLEQPIGEDEDSELGNLIENDQLPTPSQSVFQNLLEEKIEQVLNTLSEREAKILRLRFGLYDGRDYSLEEVGILFGLTRERIRQIEGVALRRLRHPRRSRQLRGYLGD